MNILLLGGTSEGRQLAAALAPRTTMHTTLSLAGVIRRRPPMPVPVRIGGFGGVAGLEQYIRAHAIDVVIDATHPFAAQMSRHAVAACRATGCAIWRLQRPAWQAQAADAWHPARDLADAAAQLPAFGPCVFLSVGARSLTPFAGVAHKHWLVRSIQPPEPPPAFADWTLIHSRPPFTLADELELMRAHDVNVLVTKNSGAAATTAKLEAARSLRIPVLMVQRPQLPAADRLFSDIAAVQDALDRRAATHARSG